MDDDALKLVEVVLGGRLVVDVVEGLPHVGLHVQVLPELAEGVELEFLHPVVVELESLQGQDQYVGQGLDADPLGGFDLLVAFLAEVGVLPL